jgi:hypothetical protein
MEGNKENQDRIHALEKYNQDANEKAKAPAAPAASPNPNPAVSGESSGSGSGSSNRSPVNVRVPDEVLDQQGYETYMDKQGQVMLRKRQHVPQSSASMQQQMPIQNVSLTPRTDNGGGNGNHNINNNSNLPANTNNNGSGSAKGKSKADSAQAVWDNMRATALGGIGGTMTGAGAGAGVRDPKALEEMVERVMHNLPRLQGLRGGEERAAEVEEALKKLDKGFDGGS